MTSATSNAIEDNPNKYCEYCGELSPHTHYMFVLEHKYLIFLKNSHIIKNDTSNRQVTLSNGQVVNYDYTCNNIAYALKHRYIPHLFCSDQCVVKMTTTQIHPTNYTNINAAAVDCTNKQFPLWDVTAFRIDAINYRTDKCSVCGRLFPNGQKQFITQHIEDVIQIALKTADVSIPDGYEMMHANTSDITKGGKAWAYRLSQYEDKTKTFCSNECVFEYAQKHNSLIHFPNLVMQGYATFITPYMREANKGLGHNCYCRPQKLVPLE